MNYGQIVLEAWQVFKKTRLLLLFIPLFFLSDIYFYELGKSTNLAWLWDLLWLVSILMFGFSSVGIILSADRTIQGKSISLKELWRDFWKKIIRLYILFIIVIVPLLFPFLCCSFLSSYQGIKLSWTPQLILMFVTPVVIGVLNFSVYGLILYDMKILASLKHGMSGFIQNFFKVVIVGVIGQIPIFLFDLISAGLASRGTFSYTAFSEISSKVPFQLAINVLNTFTIPFTTIMLLLVYHKFIRAFDYPALEATRSS